MKPLLAAPSIGLLVCFFMASALFSTPASAARDWCVDLKRRSVAEDFNAPGGEFARAYLDIDGRPRISYNRRLMDGLPRAMQYFVAAHECAHHALGHLGGARFGRTRFGAPSELARELEADCWAARKLIEHGVFTAGDVRVVMRELSHRLAADEAHLPGSERARRVGACAGIL